MKEDARDGREDDKKKSNQHGSRIEDPSPYRSPFLSEILCRLLTGMHNRSRKGSGSVIALRTEALMNGESTRA